MARLLPQGIQTPNQFLLTLTDDGTPVGVLCYALRSQGGERIAFVYDIEIRPEHRREGYASAALHTLEALARNHSASKVQLLRAQCAGVALVPKARV